MVAWYIDACMPCDFITMTVLVKVGSKSKFDVCRLSGRTTYLYDQYGHIQEHRQRLVTLPFVQ